MPLLVHRRLQYLEGRQKRLMMLEGRQTRELPKGVEGLRQLEQTSHTAQKESEPLRKHENGNGG